MCKTSNVGLLHYESELRFQELVFKVGNVNIAEATGSVGHSVNYMLRITAVLFYLSYSNCSSMSRFRTDESLIIFDVVLTVHRH